MVMEGRVRGVDGAPISHAVIDLWRANEKGRCSSFDPDRAPYHLRGKITTDAEGRYRFRSVIPPGSPTSQLFALLGRHGNRPAHIHFLVSANGHRALTTQVNLPVDPYLDYDFAYATRDELGVALEPVAAAAGYESLGLTGAFKPVRFDFRLQPAQSARDAEHLGRVERVA